MSEITKEARLLQTFASLADTLVDGYDVVDLLQLLVDTCQDLLDTTAAAILLAGPERRARRRRLDERGEPPRRADPDQRRSGSLRGELPDGRGGLGRRHLEVPEAWARFRVSALELGFASVHAVPMRLRDNTIGTLNLLRDQLGELDEQDRIAARAFADVATIGILHERSLRETAVLTEQLQGALTSRIVIEQAKGVVAYTNGVTIEEAFELIRRYARSHQLGISHVAARLVDRSLRLDD